MASATAGLGVAVGASEAAGAGEGVVAATCGMGVAAGGGVAEGVGEVKATTGAGGIVEAGDGVATGTGTGVRYASSAVVDGVGWGFSTGVGDGEGDMPIRPSGFKKVGVASGEVDGRGSGVLFANGVAAGRGVGSSGLSKTMRFFRPICEPRPDVPESVCPSWAYTPAGKTPKTTRKARATVALPRTNH